MALPSTGSISMSQVRTELGLTDAISLNLAAVRTLAGKASGAISMSDLRGKSNSVLALDRTAGIYSITVGRYQANGFLNGAGLLVSTVKFSDGSTGASFNSVVFSNGSSPYSTAGTLLLPNSIISNITTTATIVSTTGKSVRVRWTVNTGIFVVPNYTTQMYFRESVTLTEV